MVESEQGWWVVTNHRPTKVQWASPSIDYVRCYRVKCGAMVNRLSTLTPLSSSMISLAVTNGVTPRRVEPESLMAAAIPTELANSGNSSE